MARKFNLKPLPPIGITDTHKEGARCFFPFFLCFFFVVVFSFLVLGQKTELKREVVGQGRWGVLKVFSEVISSY